MVGAALADGTADRDCVFEVFARRLPHGRRYGVVAGTGRLLEALPRLPVRRRRAGRAPRAGPHRRPAARLAGRLPLQRRHRRLRRGRAVLPRAPRCSPCARPSPRACCWRRSRCRCSTTTARSPRPPPGWSPPPASGRASRWAPGAPTRRPRSPRPAPPTWSASRSTSNLEAGRRYGVPTTGTSAHAFTLLHDDEAAAFRAQVDDARHGDDAAGRHLRRRAGHPHRGRGRRPGARRDPARLRRPADAGHAAPASCSTSSARPAPAIVVTSDLDEYAIAGLHGRAGRRLRRRHLAGHRLRRADGRHGLQAGRAGRRPGGEALGGQALGGRPQVRRPPARPPTARPSPRWSAPADRAAATATATSSSRWCADGALVRRARPRPRRWREARAPPRRVRAAAAAGGVGAVPRRAGARDRDGLTAGSGDDAAR